MDLVIQFSGGQRESGSLPTSLLLFWKERVTLSATTCDAKGTMPLRRAITQAGRSAFDSPPSFILYDCVMCTMHAGGIGNQAHSSLVLRGSRQHFSSARYPKTPTRAESEDAPTAGCLPALAYVLGRGLG